MFLLPAALLLTTCGGGSSNNGEELPTPPPKPKAWHVTTFAGGGSSGTDGIGPAAGFNAPFRIAQIGDTLYVTDENRHSIRTIDTSTVRVGTIVPNRFIGGYNDGAGTSARFDNPRGAAAGAGNTLYVADYDNHRIRKVTINPANLTAAATQVSTIAGGSTAEHANGVGTAAQFNGPTGIAVSGGTLYVADGNNHRIRAIDIATKTVRDIAGDGTSGSTNGIGTAARFANPTGIIAVSGTTFYVATQGSLIRKLEYREVD